MGIAVDHGYIVAGLIQVVRGGDANHPGAQNNGFHII